MIRFLGTSSANSLLVLLLAPTLTWVPFNILLLHDYYRTCDLFAATCSFQPATSHIVGTQVLASMARSQRGCETSARYQNMIKTRLNAARRQMRIMIHETSRAHRLQGK